MGRFGLPSDSSASAYAPSESPRSPVYSDYHSAHMSQSDMNEDRPVPGDRLSNLELAMDDMRSRNDATQKLLQTLLERMGAVPALQTQNEPDPIRRPLSRQPTPIPASSAGRKKISLKPSTPSKFDGDRSKGKEFLMSCRTYIRLCPESFDDDITKIVWAMSYMKSGRAGRWATREFKHEAASEDQTLRFMDWLDFEDEFWKDFLPLNSEATAVNTLETTAYFQGMQTVDDYLDQFQDLVYDSRYTDPKTIVVKFCRGLNQWISATVNMKV